MHGNNNGLSEDFNVEKFRYTLAKTRYAHMKTDKTLYDPATKDPLAKAPSNWARSRSNYPGSYASNNLYVFGESKQPVYPDYDREMKQQRQYDMPYKAYTSEDEFRQQYGQTFKEYIVTDNVRRTVNAQPTVRKPGIKTATGYRKPSKVDLEIARAREERAERFYDY